MVRSRETLLMSYRLSQLTGPKVTKVKTKSLYSLEFTTTQVSTDTGLVGSNHLLHFTNAHQTAGRRFRHHGDAILGTAVSRCSLTIHKTRASLSYDGFVARVERSEHPTNKGIDDT